MGTLLLTNIDALYQVRQEQVTRPLAGAEQSRIPTIQNAFLLIENGRIAEFGAMTDVPDHADTVLDIAGKSILPSWCDSHTHLVFAQSREGEFVDRIHGLSYEEIAEKGGGILNSARRLRNTDEDDLFDSAWQRLQEVIALGTGAIEIKSGYGLSLKSELKMLRVIRRLREKAPIPVRATFLGAHAIPQEYRGNREQYLQLIINEMLPRVSAEGLADYMDVFCDRGFFTPEETDKLLKAGLQYGLKPKIHANQLAVSGGVQVGVANGALSVDHLEEIDNTVIETLKHSETIATLLPSCPFFLDVSYAPARKLIDAQIPVALASDYNPGSTPSGRMSLVVSLGCIKMKMTPEEAVNAATINGAFAMELGDTVGAISKGLLANLIITKSIPSLAYIPYAFGSDLIEKVILKGEIHNVI